MASSRDWKACKKQSTPHDGASGRSATADKPLSPPQQAFVQRVILGDTYADAYRASYNSPSKNCSELGQRLAIKHHVAKALAEGRKMAMTEAIVTRTEMLEGYTDIWRPALSEDAGLALQVGDRLSKMLGFDAPEKHDHSLSGLPSINVVFGNAPPILASTTTRETKLLDTHAPKQIEGDA